MSKAKETYREFYKCKECPRAFLVDFIEQTKKSECTCGYKFTNEDRKKSVWRPNEQG